jgi:hypothetical protein
LGIFRGFGALEGPQGAIVHGYQLRQHEGGEQRGEKPRARAAEPGRRDDAHLDRRYRSPGGLERLAHRGQQLLAGERLGKHFFHTEPARCFGGFCETAPEAPR